MLDVLLLGNGAMMPLPGRFLSSVLFRVNGSLTLIDCGEGTQVSMRRFHWGFKRLDAICITHHHADHVAGLPGLFHTVANAGRTEPMHIYGPMGTARVVQGLRVIAPHLPFDMIIHELEDGARFILPNDVEGRVSIGEHRIPVLAYRFDVHRQPAFQPERARELGVPQHLWGLFQRGESVEVNGRMVFPDQVMGAARKGVSLGMATDTRPIGRVADLMRGVNLLISEATYGDDAEHPKAETRGHMTFREAATLARNAGTGGLWLTHFGVGLEDPSRWIENAREEFADVELGFTGLMGRLSFDAGYEPGSGSPVNVDSMNAAIAGMSPW